MGSLMGHVATGLSLFIIGLWHLFNQIKLHTKHPNSYTSSPWYPTSRIKYLELYSIMAFTSAYVSMELFIGPELHQPLAPDGTIPFVHLRSFEHSNIALAFFTYACFGVAFYLAVFRMYSGRIEYQSLPKSIPQNQEIEHEAQVIAKSSFN